MKKIVSCILALCLLLCLTACAASHIPEKGITLPEKTADTDEEAPVTPAQQPEEIPAQTAEDAPGEIPENIETPGESAEDAEATSAVPYWQDEPEGPWPTESIVDDTDRERIHTEYQKGYDLLKGQPWQFSSSDEQLATNIPLLLDALSHLTAEETPHVTYAHMKVAALTQDAETYLGELTHWARVSIDSVEQVAAESELAQALNSGSAFCIVYATTRHEEAIELYIMNPDEIDSWYRAGMNHSIQGWIVGADSDAVVLCVPGLSGG